MKIAEAIQKNTTLQKLNISHNNISKHALTLASGYLKHNNSLQELITSRNDNSTVHIFTSTTKCCVNKLWLYSEHYRQTQYFIRTYESGLSTKSSFFEIDSHLDNLYLQFYDTEALLLTSLVNNNVKKLEIIKSQIPDDAAIASYW